MLPIGDSTGGLEKTVAVEARVLILAATDRYAGPLSEGLDRLGWRTVTARTLRGGLAALNDLNIEAAVVDLTDGEPDALALPARLKAAAGLRRLPVAALGRPDPVLAQRGFDLVLTPPPHPAQAAVRIEALVRAAIAEEEFELRASTFAGRGKRLPAPDEARERPLSVLTIGEPAPKFLRLSNALSARGVETTAAFTSFTAFDYLHDRPFDAVALWAGDDPQEALSIASGMRRNTGLYHLPALLYLDLADEALLSEAFHRGVSDIASPEEPEALTAARLEELAGLYRRQGSIRRALEQARASGLMDAVTGLFTRDLFAAHLAKLSVASRARRRPLSVCVLKVSDRPEVIRARAGGYVDRAVPQIGSMIGRLVRAEDTAARLAPEVFALALPATTQGSARAAGERIAAVIGCTAFDAGEGRPAFVVDFDIGVAQVEPEESAARTLERAAARAAQRQAS